MKLVILIIIFSFSTYASYLSENVKKLNWKGIDVVWLEDTTLPNYFISIYFGDGALSDKKNFYGETMMMFNNLEGGTERYTQKEVSDALEFYGASTGSSVTHEYSTYKISGLVKDVVPTMKMVCHLFQNATFPVKRIRSHKNRLLAGIKNITTSPGDVADRVFREVSLNGTKFQNPVEGKVQSIKRIRTTDLKSKLSHFNNNVFKKIYMTGPKQLKSLENIFKSDCGWSQSKKTVQSTLSTKITKKLTKNKQRTIYLVPVTKSNQAQIRIGRYITDKEAQNDHIEKYFASSFIGGGFTSRLMQVLRVQKAMVYSAGSYISSQRGYGRSGITTATRNENLREALSTIESLISKSSKKIDSKLFMRSKNYLKGSYLFTLESSKVFLNNLLYFDHIGRSWKEMPQFPSKIEKVSKSDLKEKIFEIFNWEEQTIVIVGSIELKKELSKIGNVKILDYNSYL